jgi:hypothetical protein
MTMGQEHGKEHLFEHVDALLVNGLLVGIEFLFVFRLFSFESRFSFMVLTKLCMLKCRHLRVRVRAPKATMMRRREALALLPVLPLAVDPVHLLVEMQVL